MQRPAMSGRFLLLLVPYTRFLWTDSRTGRGRSRPLLFSTRSHFVPRTRRELAFRKQKQTWANFSKDILTDSVPSRRDNIPPTPSSHFRFFSSFARSLTLRIETFAMRNFSESRFNLRSITSYKVSVIGHHWIRHNIPRASVKCITTHRSFYTRCAAPVFRLCQQYRHGHFHKGLYEPFCYTNLRSR